MSIEVDVYKKLFLNPEIQIYILNKTLLFQSKMAENEKSQPSIVERRATFLCDPLSTGLDKPLYFRPQKKTDPQIALKVIFNFFFLANLTNQHKLLAHSIPWKPSFFSLEPSTLFFLYFFFSQKMFWRQLS